MLINKKSNLLLRILFISILFIFSFYPSKQSESRAEYNQYCSLNYDIGCQAYYCWNGSHNNAYCDPCGYTGC
jgi:hypothetical protein